MYGLHLQLKSKYIGKKIFHFSKTIQKNLKKKKVKVESDWKTYNGSNDELHRSSNAVHFQLHNIRRVLQQLDFSKSNTSSPP